MTERIKELIVRLEKAHSLTEAEYAEMIEKIRAAL